ncbi:MAG: ABC transporter substrate-binding protein [Alphaproteobacteria bacterium]|nr:ABC transporter substrate-binding protein [Alphaproteobacteria bacterium]
MSRIMAWAAVLAVAWLANVAAAADPLVLQLRGPAQFEFAGYYAALWQGFYAEAGLSIDIQPGAPRGQPPTDPVRELAEGRAQFGVGGAELVVRAAQGFPLLILAPIFQQSGAAVYYRADADFGSPVALGKAKLARLPASDILGAELASALQAEGIDPSKLKTTLVEPGQVLGVLADKTIDAAIGTAWDLPWLAKEKGLNLKSFNPADYRVEFYGDTLFTLQRLAREQPDTVRNFRLASLRGWEYALQHPDEIAGRLVATLPHPPGVNDAAGFAHYQADVARRLSRYPEIPLGHSNPDRWNRIEASLLGAGALLRTIDADEFLYDPDAEARSRTDLRAFAILGGTLVAGLLAIALLWLRWQRRSSPAANRSPASAAATAAQPTKPRIEAPPPPAAPVRRPPAEPASRQPAPDDLNAVLTKLERTIRQRLPRGVGYRASLLRDLWGCSADPQGVRRVVLDLVAEAGADTASGGQLILGTRNYAFDKASVADTPGAEIGEFVRLTVRDSGPGLSEEALDRVFDPEATKRPAAVRAAEEMRRLGGFIRVESAEAVGTAVHLYFPRAEPAALAEPKHDKAAPAAAE